MTYEVKKGEPWRDARSGPKLDSFPLASMEVNDCFQIPLVKNAKGKMVPKQGFNLKAANALYDPAVFKKRRDDSKNAIVVQRVK